MGMRRDDFYTMPLGEFWEALDAWNRHTESERRHMGELVRGAALRLFNINLKRTDQIQDPRDFWRMPWDEETERDEAARELAAMTPEQRENSARDLLKRIGW